MKKVASILAVVVFAIGMVSCENDSASNDDLYDIVDTNASDKNYTNSSGGSGGN